VTGLNVVPKLLPQPPRAGHKSPLFFTRVSTKPPSSAIGAVLVSFLCRTTPVPQARLALPLAPLMLARPRVDLAGLPTRWSQSPGGRRRVAIDELHSSREPRANQPSQRLH
jgi:hypothetical protein